MPALGAALRPPPASGRPERDLALEGLRGLCAGAVFYAHAFAPTAALDPAWAPPAQFWWFNVGYAAVLMFFVLSGYVIGLTTTQPATRESMGRYLSHRALRLVPVNTVAVLLAWAVLPVLSARLIVGHLFFLQNGEPYPGGLLIDLLPTNPNLWSLNYEVVYYLAFLALWRWAPRAGWVWLGLAVLSFVSAGLPSFAVISHYACGGLYWLGGLAIAWQLAPAGESRRGAWPAAMLGAYAIWTVGPLREIIGRIHAYPLMAITPAAPHRLDFLPAALWLLLAVTGRGPVLQRRLGWFCLGWTVLGLGVRMTGDGISSSVVLGALAVVGAWLLRNWSPGPAALARCATLGTISFGLYAVAIPLQFAQRAIFPWFGGSALTFAVRLAGLLVLALGLAWILDRRVQPWLRRRLTREPARLFPRETSGAANPPA